MGTTRVKAAGILFTFMSCVIFVFIIPSVLESDIEERQGNIDMLYMKYSDMLRHHNEYLEYMTRVSVMDTVFFMALSDSGDRMWRNMDVIVDTVMMDKTEFLYTGLLALTRSFAVDEDERNCWKSLSYDEVGEKLFVYGNLFSDELELISDGINREKYMISLINIRKTQFIGCGLMLQLIGFICMSFTWGELKNE